MTQPTYWLNLFSPTTWKEFEAVGGEITGFREGRWSTVQQVRPGDRLLCYLTQVSRFVAVLEATSEPFWDETPIWKDAVFPARLRVQPVAKVTPETAVPILELRDQLSIFQNLSAPHAWTGRLRGSPTRWKREDGEAIFAALQAAQQNPVHRPLPQGRMPKGHDSKLGVVTVPDEEATVAEEPVKETTIHTEIQWLLLKFGSDLGLDVWVARNDRNRSFGTHEFSALPRLRSALPNQFDDVTQRTIELIDVLWLRDNAIVAAFEIESTTSIYSGLLRMSDLLAMQPNLNIPLYLVAPDDRREKVLAEVNRPTFSRLQPPLNRTCRYIPFSTLRERLAALASVARYLKPDVLDELSQSCEIEVV
jgi:hypothetical protein